MIIYQTTMNSSIGLLTMASTDQGVCMLEFDNQKRINKHHASFTKLGYKIINKPNNHLEKLYIQLKEYFNLKRKVFELPLDTIGTAFQKSVWDTLLTIPFGVTRSYLEQSKVFGDIKAIRAVANANGQNKISIVIPCHRVIASNGALTGFGGGLWRKKILLDLESKQLDLFK